jgi:predicted lysophospholipase L1 biosynthesis ABC-type transport system permease subunit
VIAVFFDLPQWLDDAFWFVFIAIIAVFGFAFAGGLIVLAWGLL